MSERDDRFEHLVDGDEQPSGGSDGVFDATTPITLPETAAPHRVDEGTLLPENQQPSRHRLIGSIVAGLALLAGIGVVLALVFGGAFDRGILPAGGPGFGEPAGGDAPAVAVTSMPFDESIDCTSTDRFIEVSWTTDGASSVAFYEGRWIEDGEEGTPLYDSLPADGDSADFPDAVEYPCPAPTQQYTLVATAEDGSTSSRVITISGTS